MTRTKERVAKDLESATDHIINAILAAKHGRAPLELIQKLRKLRDVIVALEDEVRR